MTKTTLTRSVALTLGLCAVVAAGAWADGTPVNQGQWINLFDGATLFGWTAMGDGDWQVQNAHMVATKGGAAIRTTSPFSDFELVAKVRATGGDARVCWCCKGCASCKDCKSCSSCKGPLATVKAGGSAWHTVRILASGMTATCSVDGALVGESASTIKRKPKPITISLTKDGKIEVAEVRLRPLGMASLFNRKDLTGWELIPNHKSVFKAVNGTINVTDGNGQLETSGLYKDFLLQIDVISNGTHLNSGVFFRGPKGVFWKGYESQVRNQWQGDDRTKPVDFGTGGLYGIQDARKVVPSDGEWFTKTVVCVGTHMAVWINGYQVSDFEDTRAEAADGNAKEGLVSKAGTIHLQGHDPTTNLSFTNILLQNFDK
ncbi:MAG: DUF1080 domain-containing protein [bacterium]|nr:DUF1080 domain-containing protein [bacterium]